MPHGLSFTHYNRILAVVMVSSAIGASIPYRHHRPSTVCTAVLPGTKGGKKRKTGKTGKRSTAVYCWKIFARGAHDLNLGVHFHFLVMK